MNKDTKSVTVRFSEDELYFLEWAMGFIYGGVSGDEEEQRSQMEYKAKKLLSDIDDGILFFQESGTIHLNCGFCGGIGAYPSEALGLDNFEVCPVCDGKGINSFQATRENLLKCRLCGGNGMGYDEDCYATGEPCNVCKGTGFVLLEPIEQDSEYEIIWKQIHPKIISVAKSRFISGHYADSVEAAFKEINKCVKKIVKSEIGEELDGSSLMYRAFSPNNPIIKIGDTTTESGKNIQQGYMQIFAGAMIGIRNPKAHDNLEINSSRAIHLLTLSSLLMSKLDEQF